MQRCELGDNNRRSSSSSSMERSGPRIYVPLSVPDTSQPTYAVLEFVGFSSPANSTPHHPSPITSPAMLCLPPVASSASSLVPSNPTSFFPLTVNPSLSPIAFTNGPPNTLSSNLPITQYVDNKALYMPASTHGPIHHARPNHGARLEVVNLESPPSSPSSMAPSSASTSVSRESKEKNPHPTNISYVVKPMGASVFGGVKPQPPSSCAPASTSPTGSSKAMANFSSSSEGGVMQTKISVSQTDRETIVHTHSSNFRDVVRQLTGASSDDQDLLPVTLPARLANRVNNTINSTNAGANAEVSSANKAVSELGLRKAPLKLHERRKSSMKNLEKLSTAFHAPLNPSPVTPLASDFERFCNASTPTSQGNSALNSPIALISKAKPNIEGGNIIVERRGDQQAMAVTQETSFYLQRPPAARPPTVEKTSPTLLSLFPESPVCSPRDR